MVRGDTATIRRAVGQKESGDVLVVDDDAAIRRVIETFLAGEGYRVRAAQDGVEALRLVGEAPPDVILLDLWMPGVDGVSFARRYRAARGPHAPVIVMTASGRVIDVPPDVVVDGYLEKPFDLDELEVLVARHVAAANVAGTPVEVGAARGAGARG